MNVVAGLIEVERRVRADGFETERVPGWETRGSGTLVPRGKVNHWTAGPRNGDAPSLRVVTFGREGLRNALANTYSSRKPKLYLIAARTAWHAGRGSWQGVTGNSSVLGHEPECSGPGDWSQAHIELMLSLDRAQLEVFGYGLSMVCDHFEWAKPQGRKPDRGDIGGPPWRARLASTPTPPSEDEMALVDENVQRKLQLMGEAGILDDFMRLHADFFGKHKGSPTSMGHLLRFYRGVRDRIPRDDPQDVGRQVAYGAVQGNRLREVTDEQGSTIRGVVEGAIRLIRSHRAEPDQDVLD